LATHSPAHARPIAAYNRRLNLLWSSGDRRHRSCLVSGDTKRQNASVSRPVLCVAVAVAAAGIGINNAARAHLRVLEPRTLASVDGHVTAFAQDGPRIAWLAPFGDCTRAVVVQTLTTGRQVRLVTRRSRFCSRDALGLEDALSLAKDRVVYALNTGAGNTEFDGVFVTTSIGDRRERKVCDYALMTGQGIPDAKFTARGDGPTSIAVVSGDPVEDGDKCSKLWRVDSRGRAIRLSQIPSSSLIAVAERRFAVASGTVVDVRDQSGRLIREIPLQGTARAIALSADLVAVLARTLAGADDLQVYAVATGARRWSVRLPKNISPSLSIAQSTIVYGRRREIWVADAASRRTRLVATAAAPTIGLSIEGRRVAWAEDVNGKKGRIRAVTLPG
jgi:outer membrane protein assembly factor BamB